MDVQRSMFDLGNIFLVSGGRVSPWERGTVARNYSKFISNSESPDFVENDRVMPVTILTYIVLVVSSTSTPSTCKLIIIISFFKFLLY
jgi:hypothetical protein